jgi:RNA polymerase sigma factor (sigma-70 family)
MGVSRKAGDRAPPTSVTLSFDAFFHATYVRLAQGVLLLTSDRSEAEDVAQETMVRVLERWERVRTMASPEGYAFRVAMNVHRKRRRRASMQAHRAREPERAGDALRRAELQREVLDMLASLTIDQR